MPLIERVAQRYFEATSMVRVVVDVPATMAARKKYPLFTDMVVGRFDQSLPLFRIFDETELAHMLATGKVTGGSYAVKAEREHGASWGYNISAIIAWGNGQRGTRLSQHLYLAKIDILDRQFAHLGPEVHVDPTGPDEQIAEMRIDRCNTGLGCSLPNVSVGDVEQFYKVDPDGQIHNRSLADLKAEVKHPEPEALPPEKVRLDTFGLQPKTKFVVTKGSNALGIQIRNYGIVQDVYQVEGDSRVDVVLWFAYPRKFPDGRWTRDSIKLYATHPNRLKENEIALMNSKGDRILIRRKLESSFARGHVMDMNDPRWKTAGRYDKHLANAKAAAKAQWGTGWANLTPEMRTAFVCKELCGILAGIDFRAALDGKSDSESSEIALAMLDGVIDVCEASIK